MAATLLGSGGGTSAIIWMPGEKVSSKKNGLAQCHSPAACAYGSSLTLMPVKGSAHRVYTNLYLSEWEWLRDEGDLSIFDLLYEGVDMAGDVLPPPVYTLMQGITQDPIDSNINFVSNIGGKKGAELNGAVFNEDGTFKGFKAVKNDGTANTKAGMTEYYLATHVWRKNWVSTIKPSDTKDSGYIGTPEGTPPGLEGDSANWLVGPYTIIDRGGGTVYEMTLDWLGSGPNGWDADTYTKPT